MLVNKNLVMTYFAVYFPSPHLLLQRRSLEMNSIFQEILKIVTFNGTVAVYHTCVCIRLDEHLLGDYRPDTDPGVYNLADTHITDQADKYIRFFSAQIVHILQPGYHV
jgi:hypothetical protein